MSDIKREEEIRGDGANKDVHLRYLTIIIMLYWKEIKAFRG